MMFSTKNIIETKSKKNLNKYTKFFEILTKIKKQAYRLKLFLKWKIHSIFHILLFENYNNIYVLISKVFQSIIIGLYSVAQLIYRL